MPSSAVYMYEFGMANKRKKRKEGEILCGHSGVSLTKLTVLHLLMQRYEPV